MHSGMPFNVPPLPMCCVMCDWTMGAEFDRQRNYVETQLTSLRTREEANGRNVTKLAMRNTAENNFLVKFCVYPFLCGVTPG